MEQIYKVLKSEDLESLSQYVNTRYGQKMGQTPGGPGAFGQTKSGIGVTDGFRKRSAGKQGTTMVQTFLSGQEGGNAPLSVGSFNSPMPHNESIYSANAIEKQKSLGYTGSESMTKSSNTFQKRTTSVSKPVDRDIMDQFRALTDSCGQADWSKRLKAIDELQDWVVRYSKKVRSS